MPGSWRRVRLVLVHEVVAKAAQSGIHMLLDTGHEARAILIGDGRHRAGRMGLGRQGQQALDLLDGAAHWHRGRVRPSRDAFAQRLDVLVDHGRIGRVARQELLEPLRRVGRLVLGELGRPYLRAGHVVDGELVPLLRQLLEVVFADQDDRSRVMTCSGSSPSAGMRRASSSADRIRRLVRGSAGGAEIGPAIVVAFVAQDGGPHRVTLQETLQNRSARSLTAAFGSMAMDTETFSLFEPGHGAGPV